jgi:ribosomal protein L33
MDKKDYNKIYYETNKAKIAEKLYCKETCPHCQKVVSHQNMKSHQKHHIASQERTLMLDNN